MKKFYCQFGEDFPSHALSNDLPSETVPDQAMTIPEIIARFTRTGMLPQSFLKDDEGDQEAGFEPDFDPLDHNPDEFNPEVHSGKLKALQTISKPSKEFSEESSAEPPAEPPAE